MRRGNRRSPWVRPVLAGVIALVLLLLALLALDRAGGHLDTEDAVAVVAVAILVGAMLA